MLAESMGHVYQDYGYLGEQIGGRGVLRVFELGEVEFVTSK